MSRQPHQVSTRLGQSTHASGLARMDSSLQRAKARPLASAPRSCGPRMPGLLVARPCGLAPGRRAASLRLPVGDTIKKVDVGRTSATSVLAGSAFISSFSATGLSCLPLRPFPCALSVRKSPLQESPRTASLSAPCDDIPRRAAAGC